MTRPVCYQYCLHIFHFVQKQCGEIPIIQDFTPLSEDHCRLHNMYSLITNKCVYNNNYFQLNRDYRVRDPMVFTFSSIDVFNVYRHER